MKFPLMSLAAVAAAHVGYAPTPSKAVATAVSDVPSVSSTVIVTPRVEPRPVDPSTVIKTLSLVPGTGKAAVVIDADPSVEIDDFTLKSPDRVVIDIKGATLAKPAPAYDRVARGGITNIRIAQFRDNIVRVVLDLDQKRAYKITRKDNQIHVAVESQATDFEAWYSAGAERTASTATAPSATASNAAASTASSATTAAATPSQPAVAAPAPAPAAPAVTTVAQELAMSSRAPAPRANAASPRDQQSVRDEEDDRPAPMVRTTRYAQTLTPATQQSRQPKITVNYQDADIRDVIAAFAAFSGRTIVVGKDVEGTVTAEIRNQPWDVALRAILAGQGLAASEDPTSGIISVDSYANIKAKQALEPLVTQLLPLNYAKADSLVPVITKLLAKDCTGAQSQDGQGSANNTSAEVGCYTRGAVASNPSTNTLIITETPSRIGDIINYVQNLDIRTPQVAIKAKIIFVNRTDIENLGVSYDLGTQNQFFSQLVKRVDPSTLQPVDIDGDGVPDGLGGGKPYDGDRISLGGNTIAAIANANNRIASPALSLVYSAALGKFSLTSFLDALQEVRLADLQAEPSIVTVDNKEAQIQVGQDVPVRVLDASTAGVATGSGNNIPRATVSFKPVGIILRVTPHITNNRQILLDVHAENSDAQIASSDVGYVFNKQSADNQLLVVDGETAVIGGLTVTQVSNNRTGIPILGDLPILGHLFSTTTKSEEKRDLLILITPHIVDEGDRGATRSR